MRVGAKRAIMVSNWARSLTWLALALGAAKQAVDIRTIVPRNTGSFIAFLARRYEKNGSRSKTDYDSSVALVQGAPVPGELTRAAARMYNSRKNFIPETYGFRDRQQ